MVYGLIKKHKTALQAKAGCYKTELGFVLSFPSISLSFIYVYLSIACGCQVLKLVFIDKRIELARVSHGSSRSFTFEASNSSVIDNSVAGNFIFRTPTSQSNCIESLGYQRRFFKRKITLIN
jgi:hypothetical protein